MADPRAFVSFDFDHDATSRMLFVGQAKSDSPTPFTVQDWSSKAALQESNWKEIIGAKIGKCHMVIVLVGEHMGTATGVAEEIKMALDKDVPLFGVYVNGGSTSSVLPAGLPRSRVVAWEWADIAAMVDWAMTQGKNAKAMASYRGF